MKVKKKLPLLMIMLVVVPLLILSSVISIYMSNSSLEMRKQSLSDVARSMASYLHEFYNSQISNIQFTSQIPLYAQYLEHPEDAVAKKQSTDLLSLSVKANTNIDINTLIDINGTVLTSSDESLIGTNVKNAPFFSALIDEKKGIVSKIILNEEKNINKLSLSASIQDSNGAIIGVINRIISISDINSHINQRKVGDSGYVYILDNNGSPLSYDFSPNIPYGKAEIDKLGNDTELQKFLTDVQNGRLQSNTGYFSYDYDGIPILASYEKVADSGWITVVCMTQSEVFKEAHLLQILLLLTTLIVAIISLFFGIQIANSITKPLTYLNQKIKQIQKENFSVRCNVPSNDEFHELADNINHMTESLEMSKQELIINNELLKKSAYIDSLTNIPNRKSIENTIDRLIRKHPNQAILLFDLNGFRTINNTFGHYLGDAVLISVASLAKSLSNDYTFPARFGGDQFIIFVSNYQNRREVVELAKIIIRGVHNINTLNEYPVDLSASLGIAFLEDEHTNRTDWLIQADEAMRTVKNTPELDFFIYQQKDAPFQ